MQQASGENASVLNLTRLLELFYIHFTVTVLLYMMASPKSKLKKTEYETVTLRFYSNRI